MTVHTVPAELGDGRLDRVVAVLAEVSRAAAHRLVESGGVTVDGDIATSPARRIAAGAIVGIAALEPSARLTPEPVDFRVAREDEHLAVIDKPAGVVVHPGSGADEGTLAAGLLHRWPDIEGVGEDGRWGIVHRLDKGTSGLLVVAKSAAAFGALKDLIAARRVDRTYLALVEGAMPIETGTIDAPIDRDPARPVRRRVHALGRPARTHYAQVAAWDEHTLLEVALETGRTHQIRVHLAAIGHPVVGDRVYGGTVDDAADPGRVWLHSWKLAFDHPITGGRIEEESVLPGDLVGSLNSLGKPETGALPI